MNHRVPDGKGGWRGIGCDKDAIGKVIVAMLHERIAHHDARLDRTHSRMWHALGCYFMRGLPIQWPYAAGQRGAQALQPFLAIGKWKSANDGGKDGRAVPPLMAAVFTDDAGLVRALLASKANPNHAYRGPEIPQLVVRRGMTPCARGAEC